MPGILDVFKPKISWGRMVVAGFEDFQGLPLASFHGSGAELRISKFIEHHPLDLDPTPVISFVICSLW